MTQIKQVLNLPISSFINNLIRNDGSSPFFTYLPATLMGFYWVSPAFVKAKKSCHNVIFTKSPQNNCQHGPFKPTYICFLGVRNSSSKRMQSNFLKELLSKVCKPKLPRIQYQTNFNYYLYINCRKSLCSTSNIIWTLSYKLSRSLLVHLAGINLSKFTDTHFWEKTELPNVVFCKWHEKRSQSNPKMKSRSKASTNPS